MKITHQNWISSALKIFLINAAGISMASAALVYEVNFDGASPATTTGTGGQIGWDGGSAPIAGDVVTGPTGFGSGYSFATVRPYEQVLPTTVNANNATVSFFFKGRETSNFRDYLSIGTDAANQLFFETNGANGVSIFNNGTFGGGPGLTTNSAGAIDFNAWNHIALTLDSSNNQSVLYLNGFQTATSTWAAGETFNILQLGSRFGEGVRASPNASIDEVRIYDETLDATAIANLSTIPEPSSIALLGLGGIALILRRRKES